MQYLEKFIEGINNIVVALAELFSIAPLDLLIIFVLFGLFLGVGFQYGKRRIIALIISLYIASFVYLQFPYIEKILSFDAGVFGVTAVVVSVFSVFFIVLYITVHRVVRASFPLRSGRRWLEAALLGIFSTTLVLALSYHVIPIEEIYDFSEPIDHLFESTEFFFWWLVAPLVILLTVGKGGGYDE